MDVYGEPAARNEISAFIRLLWEKGTAHEHQVIEGLTIPVLDLSVYSGDVKEQRTREAMERREPLIYSGRIRADDLLGEPDLLRREENGYVAGDIKSGSGEEGQDDDATLKKHYGVQLAIYTDILERLELCGSRKPFVWDIHKDEISYDLDEPQGKRNPVTIWKIYQKTLTQARRIISRSEKTRPAYSAACKLCHWYSACLAELDSTDDLTLLPDVGRTKRDVMAEQIPTRADLVATDLDSLITGEKTVFPGIGPDTLHKLQARATLVKTPGARPYLTAPLCLPSAETELFFDVEVDPMRDFCYLHGFVERRQGDNSTERYVPYFADSVNTEEEQRAFTAAWQYIADHQPCVVYYYSKYERTIWRKLQSRYPDACSKDDIEQLFDSSQSVDLYFDVVKKATEWPTRDHSIKTLAKFLGFAWRDTHPSGAASIEWFDRWVRTGDTAVRKRILDYNEDDCVATRVLLDAVKALIPADG